MKMAGTCHVGSTDHRVSERRRLLQLRISFDKQTNQGKALKKIYEMKLTECLMRFKPALPGGNLWRGKYRLYKKVTPLDAAILRRQYDIEEQNLFYLRHPYLTVEEARGHVVEISRYPEILKDKARKLKWRDDLTLNDHLGILKVTDRWE